MQNAAALRISVIITTTLVTRSTRGGLRDIIHSLPSFESVRGINAQYQCAKRRQEVGFPAMFVTWRVRPPSPQRCPEPPCKRAR
jgi:hypothetical protein